MYRHFCKFTMCRYKYLSSKIGLPTHTSQIFLNHLNRRSIPIHGTLQQNHLRISSIKTLLPSLSVVLELTQFSSYSSPLENISCWVTENSILNHTDGSEKCNRIDFDVKNKKCQFKNTSPSRDSIFGNFKVNNEVIRNSFADYTNRKMSHAKYNINIFEKNPMEDK